MLGWINLRKFYTFSWGLAPFFFALIGENFTLSYFNKKLDCQLII